MMVLEFFLWFLISSKEPPVIQWSDLCVHCIDYATQEYEKNNMYLPILQSKNCMQYILSLLDVSGLLLVKVLLQTTLVSNQLP